MKESNNLKFTVGIDIAKEKHHVTILEITGSKVVQQFFFSNCVKGFNKLDQAIQKYCGVDEVLISMEATAHYYEVLARWLEFKTYKIIVCNPRQSKYLRNVLKPYFKTDPIDSQVLAKGAELGLLKGELYEKPFVQMKELLQLHKKLTRDLTGIKNQTTRLMDVIFPERKQVIRGLFGKASLELLKLAPSPEDIANLKIEDLTRLFLKYSRGKFKQKDAEKLQQISKVSVGISDAIWLYELKLMIPRIILLQEQLVEVKIEIKNFSNKCFPDEVSKLQVIPGVSSNISAAIVGFLGNINRFKGKRPSRKVTAFAGLAVMQYSSGKKERLGKISKAGPSLLRFHLGCSAKAAVKVKGPLQDFYEGLIGRGVAKGKAIVAVMGKILRCSFYMLRDGMEFDPRKLVSREKNDYLIPSATAMAI